MLHPLTVESPMQFMLIIQEAPEDIAARDDAERAGAYWAGWQAYSQALREAGVTVGGNALQPAETATTLRMRGGERVIQDGPFADSKEVLGGYYIIEVDDLDAALGWAARCPGAAHGAIEVRPVLSM
jgi:hypothetical protein